MAKFGFADADRRGNVVKRREADRKFLAELRACKTKEDVRLVAARFGGKDAPQWKMIAIARALNSRESEVTGIT